MHPFRPKRVVGHLAISVALWLAAGPFAVPHARADDPQSGAGAEAAATDHQRFQGSWECIASIKDGLQVTDYVGVRVQFEGDRLTWFFPQKDGTTRTSKATFKIDPSQNPKHFDWAYEESPDKFHRRLYVLEGDVLVMSANISAPSERPKSLNAGQYLFVVKRMAKEE